MQLRMFAAVLAGASCLLVGYGMLPTAGAEFVDKKSGTIVITVDIPDEQPAPAHMLPAPETPSAVKPEVPRTSESNPAPVTSSTPAAPSTPEVPSTETDSAPAESEIVPTPTSEPTEAKEASDEADS